MNSMTLDTDNINFKLAYDFVSTTNSTIYLTGKAGTGKTTFLRYVKKNCRKNLVVVAPTGVAAINAGGVTMHSFFQLPFGPYLPDVKTGFGMNEGLVDKNTLLKNLRVNKTKRKLIEELELLIIDEVSMLRSDMLDAIDTILKVFRRSKQSFGGVQVLFIGDLHQLPPVVKDSEKTVLDKYYNSPFFFDAKVLEETSLVYIELKKIYRQNEQHFIDLLNKLRHNQLVLEDFETLNERYNPHFVGQDKNYITLTTHNYRADIINNNELQKLTSTLHEFKGQIKGDFGDKQLPTDLILHLKEGAQVMFVKNDSSNEKKFYNGKIVKVSKIVDEHIYVQFPETNEELIVNQETWENITYTFNKETGAIDEKVIGEFIQYPLRLAWAITIHKSQGLTFEKAIIDAGNSFAPGQVYVALSRCTSLEGIVLHSRITEQALHVEERIVDFTKTESKENILQQQLLSERFLFQSNKLISLFQLEKIVEQIHKLEEITMLAKAIPEHTTAIELIRTFRDKTVEQKLIADKFILQLENILSEIRFSKNTTLLKSRVKQGIAYFIKTLYQEIAEPLSEYLKSLNGKSKIKKYFQSVVETEAVYWQKLIELQESTFDEEALCETQFKVKKRDVDMQVRKADKGSSAKETLAYFVAGKTIQEIAQIRNMSNSTIEGHLAEFVKKGELEIARFLSIEQITRIKEAYIQSTDKTTSQLKQHFKEEFSYTELRMALYHLSLQEEI